MADHDERPPEDRSSPGGWIRLGLLAGVIGLLWGIGQWFGLGEWADPGRLSDLIRSSGPWGLLLFVGLWIVFAQMQLPGVVFMIAGVLIYGPLQGAIIGWAGGQIVLVITYWVIRGLGGQPLADVKKPWVRRVLGRLKEHPIATVAILRSVFVMNPLINYPIILGGVSFRDHTLGSALGLMAPTIFWAAVFGWLGPQALESF